MVSTGGKPALFKQIRLENGELKYDIERMCKIINEYTAKTAIPILKEVCVRETWDYQYTMNLSAQHPVLRESIRRLVDLKEVRIERGLYSGKIPASAGIFTLKQLGWKDRSPEDEEEYNKNRLGLLRDIFAEAKNAAE